MAASEGKGRRWHADALAALKRHGVRQVGYVPDAGLSGLIAFCEDEPDIDATVLTTEEEGVALLAGAWLGGDRGCLMMQSSGVGNIPNMLAMRESGGFPLVMIVTMRGEHAEFNPWQEPMGRMTQPLLEAAGLTVTRAAAEDAVGGLLDDAFTHAYGSSAGAAAVLISQELIGAKTW